MDLVSVDPLLNLYDNAWPIRTYQAQNPPAKFVFAQEKKGGRLGIALDSIVAHGCILSGGRVQNSVLSPNVRVNSYTEVHDSILMENVDIGRHCRIRRAIIDKDVDAPCRGPRSATTSMRTGSVSTSPRRASWSSAKERKCRRRQERQPWWKSGHKVNKAETGRIRKKAGESYNPSFFNFQLFPQHLTFSHFGKNVIIG